MFRIEMGVILRYGTIIIVIPASKATPVVHLRLVEPTSGIHRFVASWGVLDIL